MRKLVQNLKMIRCILYREVTGNNTSLQQLMLAILAEIVLCL